MYKILIIEDDQVIADEIRKHLEKWGYTVEAVTDFSNVMSHFSSFSPHLVLMDIGLPFYNGYYWCGQIRQQSAIPIVFLSSAADNMNVVMAINMGGDDFLPKPFDLEVLAAKIQAVLRRTYALSGMSMLSEYRGVILNLSEMTVFWQDQKTELSKNEFRILQTLFEKPGDIVSRDTIMKKLWDDECFVDDNTLTVNMNRLRKKLESIGLINLIVTKKGIGYHLSQCIQSQ